MGALGFIADRGYVSAARLRDPRAPAPIFGAVRIFDAFVAHSRAADEGSCEVGGGENGAHEKRDLG